MRKFETGATRDTDENKIDYEGFLSPRVLEEYGQYMTKHRKQADGQLRDSDNWQKGIPVKVYQKSLIRHIFQAWGCWRGETVKDNTGNIVELKDALYACLFNLMGLLYELGREDET